MCTSTGPFALSLVPVLSSRQGTSMMAGRGLCSLLPPAFAAVPQDFVHFMVVPLSLTEPDKRISHTSGSSVSHSDGLRPTAWIQVCADMHGGPVRPGQSLLELCPGVRRALALAVEPFEKDFGCAVDEVITPVRVIR